MPYIPHTPEETREMLRTLGLETTDDLFRSIPDAIRLARPLRIPTGKTEAEILEDFDRWAARTRSMDDRPSFLGAGSYRRFIPQAVDYLSSRGEFNTAYTPYQPEVSQGTLQAIFEYQSMICRLTAMEVSNASMYEAGTALTEAALMAYAVKRSGRKILISEGVHPEYRRVLETYLKYYPIELCVVPLEDGVTSGRALEEGMRQDALCVVIQNPNFLGSIEDGAAVERSIAQGAPEGARPFFISVVEPVSLAILAPPGSYGADIAVGDGQCLGNHPAYGGPTFGFFTTRMAHVRKMPGRIAGETRDRDGKRGYTLTFQTREQHIRRERATSNICSNQGLCALRAAMYMALLGEEGLREVAEVSARRAHHAFSRLTAIPGVEPVARAPFLNEFPLRLPLSGERAYDELDRRGIGGGLPLGRYFKERGNEMLFAFTEMTSLDDVSKLEAALKEICGAR